MHSLDLQSNNLVQIQIYCAEGKIIGELNEDKDQKINNMCKVWNDENFKNVNDIKLTIQHATKLG